MYAHELLTFKQLADRLGISVDGARHKAKRRKWEVQRTNHPGDPLRVFVPSQFLESLASCDRPQDDRPVSRKTVGDRPQDNVTRGEVQQDGQKTVSGAPEASSSPSHQGEIERIQAAHGATVAALQGQVEHLRAHMDQERAEAARRLAERDSLYLDAMGRMRDQAALERGLWLERVDAAELRAERVEHRLDQVLDHLLRRQSWWGRLFGASKRSDIEG